MFRCPASEFPFRPGRRPTASPDASSCAIGPRCSASQHGVSARATGFTRPSTGRPHPSRMTNKTGCSAARRSSRSERPVIASGTAKPISERMVGATFASAPRNRRRGRSPRGPTTTIGTRLVVCALFGGPPGGPWSSKRPWSAVITDQPPLWDAKSSNPSSATSTASAHAIFGSIAEAWPEISPVAMLTATHAGSCAAHSEQSSRPRPGSARGGSLRNDGTRISLSPGKASARPPLKKYVMCVYFSSSAALNWPRPSRETTSPTVSVMSWGAKAAGKYHRSGW